VVVEAPDGGEEGSEKASGTSEVYDEPRALDVFGGRGARMPLMPSGLSGSGGSVHGSSEGVKSGLVMQSFLLSRRNIIIGYWQMCSWDEEYGYGRLRCVVGRACGQCGFHDAWKRPEGRSPRGVDANLLHC